MRSKRDRRSVVTHNWLKAFVLALSPVMLSAQTGKVFDDLSLDSKILKGERKYAVYLPRTMRLRSAAIRSCISCTGAAMTRRDGCSLERCYISQIRRSMRGTRRR